MDIFKTSTRFKWKENERSARRRKEPILPWCDCVRHWKNTILVASIYKRISIAADRNISVQPKLRFFNASYLGNIGPFPNFLCLRQWLKPLQQDLHKLQLFFWYFLYHFTVKLNNKSNKHYRIHIARILPLSFFRKENYNICFSTF